MLMKRFFESLSLKRKKMFISVLYHGSIIVLSMIVAMIGIMMGVEFLIQFAGAVLVVDALTFRRINIVLRLQERLITEGVCPVCQATVELTSIYQCNCGFVEEKHIFRPCKMCSNSFSWLVCPECGSSIEV